MANRLWGKMRLYRNEEVNFKIAGDEMKEISAGCPSIFFLSDKYVVGYIFTRVTFFSVLKSVINMICYIHFVIRCPLIAVV